MKIRRSELQLLWGGYTGQVQLRGRQIIVINRQILCIYNSTCAPMTGDNGMQIFPTHTQTQNITFLAFVEHNFVQGLFAVVIVVVHAIFSSA